MKGRLTIDLSEGSRVSADEKAEQLVAKAVAATFPIDPLIGPELSHSISVISSVVRRHGFSIQSEIARALQDTGRFRVETNFAAGLRDGRTLSLDLLVIEPGAQWAGGYEVKRGLGSIDGARRRQLEKDLKALRVELPNISARLGFKNIKHATSGIISYYDEAVFSKELILRRADLDSHFDAKVAQRVDILTDAIRSALRSAVPLLFSGQARSEDVASPDLLQSRPLGPGDARRLLAVAQNGQST